MIKALCFVVALAWIVLCINADHACAVSHSVVRLLCSGPQLDAWMVPFITGVVGLPAVLVSIIIIIFEVTGFLWRPWAARRNRPRRPSRDTPRRDPPR